MRLKERFENFFTMLAAGILGFICPDAFYAMWEELGEEIKQKYEPKDS